MRAKYFLNCTFNFLKIYIRLTNSSYLKFFVVKVSYAHFIFSTIKKGFRNLSLKNSSLIKLIRLGLLFRCENNMCSSIRFKRNQKEEKHSTACRNASPQTINRLVKRLTRNKNLPALVCPVLAA